MSGPRCCLSSTGTQSIAIDLKGNHCVDGISTIAVGGQGWVATKASTDIAEDNECEKSLHSALWANSVHAVAGKTEWPVHGRRVQVALWRHEDLQISVKKTPLAFQTKHFFLAVS